jgi:hypothetical protein
MAVAFRAASSQVSFTGSTMVVTKPTGTVDDDLLFAVLYIESGTVTVTGVPAGWTLINNGFQANSTGPFRSYVYTKRASGEGASWTWTLSASVSTLCWGALAIQGHVGNGTYIDAADGIVDTASNTTASCPSVTTAGTNDYILALAAMFNFQTNSSGGPITTTERLDVSGIVAYDGTMSGTGATGVQTLNRGFAGGDTAYTIAILQSSGPAPLPTPASPLARMLQQGGVARAKALMLLHPIPGPADVIVVSGDVNVSNDTGLATADGGTSALAVSLDNTTGTATAAGGTTTFAATVRNLTGLATAGGGTSSLAVTVANTTGTATAAGGTSSFAATVTNAAGAATGTGGTSTLAFTLANTGGAATAGGGISRAGEALSNAGGTATAGGGTTALSVTVANAAGASTGSGGTTTLTVILANAGGTATAGGETSTASTGASANVTNVAGAATAAGGTSSLTVTVAAIAGAAAAGGGSSALAFVYANTSGAATGGGGTSTVSIVAGLSITNVTGLATAAGGTTGLAFTYATTGGLATASGGASVATVAAAEDTRFIRVPPLVATGFTRTAGTADPFVRLDSDGPDFTRDGTGHGGGFTRVPVGPPGGFRRV